MKTIIRLTDSSLFRLLLTGVAVIFILRCGWTLLPACQVLPDFFSPWFATGLLLAVIYRIVNAFGWTLVLRSMGQTIDGSLATRVWLHAESRRWLPGGVWGYASRATHAQKLDVTTGVASASMLVELLLTIAASIIVFLPVAWIYRSLVFDAFDWLDANSKSIWISAAVVLAALTLCVAARRKIVQKLESFKKRIGLLKDVSLDKNQLFVALLFLVAMGCLNGMVTACLLWSMPLTECPPLAVIIAATSFSWVIGLFAVFAPGGLFVREAAFAMSIALWMPYSDGLALAILARVIQLAAEIIGMVWVWMVGIESPGFRNAVGNRWNGMQRIQGPVV